MGRVYKQIPILRHFFRCARFSCPYLQKGFVRCLWDPAHKLNSGTTVDIIAAVLAVSVLSRYRP